MRVEHNAAPLSNLTISGIKQEEIPSIKEMLEQVQHSHIGLVWGFFVCFVF